MEKKIPNRKIQAAMVIMEARENIQFLLIFLTPCFRVYQIVLGLMIFSLFLVTYNRALMHGHNTFAHGIYNILVMCNNHYCGSSVVDLFQKLHDFFGSLRIQVSCRLVCQKDIRTVDQRPCQCNSLLFSTGKFIREGFVFDSKSNFLKYLRDTFTDYSCGTVDYSLGKRYILIYISVFQKTEMYMRT